MAQTVKHVYVVRTMCLMVAVTLVSAYSQSDNNLKYKNETHREGQQYVTDMSRVGRLSKLKQYIDSSNFQQELDKVSEAFFSLSAAYRKQIQKNDPTNLLYSSGASDVVDLQDMLISVLENAAADNSASTSTCINDTVLFIVGIFERQTWAMHFLDSFGKPGPGLTLGRFNFVGDYSLCRATSNLTADGSRRIRGNYCTLKASIGPASTLGLLNLQLGACLPDSCTATDNTLFLTKVLQKLGLNKTLQAEPAECHTDEREMTTATIASITVLLIIGVTMILGTSFDIIFIQWPKWRISSAEEDSFLTNGLMPQNSSYSAIGEHNDSPSETTTLLKEARFVNHGNDDMGVCAKVLIAFSVYTNGSKVLNTSQPPGSLSAIHGIRFLSMSWVLLGHIYVFGLSYVGNLMPAFSVLLNRWTFDAIANAFVSVDTFFTMSGLLTAYLTLTEIRKRGLKINWPLFYFHRFWRLTPPYMLTILIVLGLQQYMGSGAQWPSVQPGDKTNCENYWWANLLYINNLVDSKDMCFGHSWYLANDMQFFWLSPLMIVPFFFNVYIGMAVCVGFLLICWITTGVLSIENGWLTTLITERVGQQMNDNVNIWFEDYYIKPWCRIGAYVVGVVVGCLLAVNNGKIKMKWFTVWLGWIIAVASGLAVVYGLRGDISGESTSSDSVSALYNAVSRSVWAACICWVIIACVSGHGGFVNSILSWSPFVMLGRLTYMAYLIHPSVLFIYYQNQEQLFFITDVNVAVMFCGIVVITNMVAFVLMLALESPWIGLERTFIRKKQKD